MQITDFFLATSVRELQSTILLHKLRTPTFLLMVYIHNNKHRLNAFLMKNSNPKDTKINILILQFSMRKKQRFFISKNKKNLKNTTIKS
jgi:hypothetical protein